MGINIENIKLPLPAVANSEYVLAIKSAPYYPWDKETNKKSTLRTGSIITVVAPAREYEKFNVTIEGDNYDELFSSGKSLKVSFDGFVGKFYRNFNTNEIMFTSHAEKMIVAKN